MGKMKGQTEYKKFLKGEALSPKKAILAHCYMCNGEEEGSNEDCQGKNCPLYPFFKKWVYKHRVKARKSLVEPESGIFPLYKNKGMEG